MDMEKNNLMIFENEHFGKFRTMVIEDAVWFVGKEVTAVLGYERPTKAVVDHVDDEDRMMLTGKTQSSFGIELGQRGGWSLTNLAYTVSFSPAKCQQLMHSNAGSRPKFCHRFADKGHI